MHFGMLRNAAGILFLGIYLLAGDIRNAYADRIGEMVSRDNLMPVGMAWPAWLPLRG
jgi:hypothetical protein